MGGAIAATGPHVPEQQDEVKPAGGDGMNQATQNWLSLIGRIALAWIFIEAGFGKLTAIQGTADYIRHAGVPMADVAVWAAIVIELLGGIALAIGWKARWMAALFVVFVAVASYFFHQYWTADAAEMMNQKNHFLKNISIIGGMLYVIAFGAGGFSVDARRKR